MSKTGAAAPNIEEPRYTTARVKVEGIEALRALLYKDLGRIPSVIEAIDIAVAEGLRARGKKYQSEYEVTK